MYRYFEVKGEENLLTKDIFFCWIACTEEGNVEEDGGNGYDAGQPIADQVKQTSLGFECNDHYEIGCQRHVYHSFYKQHSDLCM